MITNHTKPSRSSGICFTIALGLVSVLAFTFFFCISGLFLGAKISWWQFPLACLFALVINFYSIRSFAGRGIQVSFIKNIAVVVVLVAASVSVAGYFYDTSFDGQWYHQENVYRLKIGYNPIYSSIAIPPDESTDGMRSWCAPDPKSPQAQATGQPVVNMKYLALNYFSKGAEITGAAIYGFTGRIETAKAVNVLMLLASFFLCLSALYQVDKIKQPFKWLLAIILAFNPITCNELFSFCVDGFGGSAILSLLAAFALILLNYNKWTLYTLFAMIIIAVNVKATMLAFTVILCAGFILVILLQKDKWYMLKSILITSIIAGALGVFVFGFNPYVTTYMRQHSVFYGLGDVKNEIDRLTPVGLRGDSRIEKLMLSVTARSGWPADSQKTFSAIAKVPFSINKSEILEANDIEAGLAGFGPFYSGALIIALVAFVIAAFSYGKTNAFRITAIALLCLIVTILIVPDSWWTRFVPQMWLLPAVILLMISIVNFKGSNALKTLLTAAMLLNVLWGSLVFAAGLLNTSFLDHKLAQLKALNKPVYIEYCDYRNFRSNQIRLSEAGIPLSTQPIIGDDECDMPFSTTHIQIPGKLPEVPQSFLFRIRSKFVSAAK